MRLTVFCFYDVEKALGFYIWVPLSSFLEIGCTDRRRTACFFQKDGVFSKHREFVSRAFITMVMDAEVTIVIFCADVQCRFMDQTRKT